MQTPTSAPRRDAKALNTRAAGGTPRTLPAPQSTLTPNNDAAEVRASERQRSAKRLRAQLDRRYEGQAHAEDAAQAPAPGLSPARLKHMVDMCLQLATENKINDRNAWALPLIDMLPDIVRAEDAAGVAGAFPFQRISGGLDAGMMIYGKRVDHTYKVAFASLQGRAGGGDDGGEGGDDEDGGGEAGGAPAAAPAPRRARAHAGDLNTADTLADANALRAKDAPGGVSEVDPLFHRTCALFDEGGAKGMLLNNLGVFGGCSIMFDSEGVPSAHFAPHAAPEPDLAVDLSALRAALASVRPLPRGIAVSSAMGDLERLLLGPAGADDVRDGSGVDGAESGAAAVMREALRDLPRRRGPCWLWGAPPAAPSLPLQGAPLDRPDSSLPEATAGDEGAAASPGDWGDCADSAAAAGGHASPACAAYTEQEPVFDADIMGAAAADAAPPDDGGGDWFGGEGGDDSDGDGEGGGALPLQPSRADTDAAMAPPAEDMLTQLLAGARAPPPTGWAGGGFWRSRSAAQQAAVKRKAGDAAPRRSRRAAADTIDWAALLASPMDAAAFAEGTDRQTCRAAASKGKAAKQLLPDDLQVEASTLFELFCKPGAVLQAPCAADATGGAPRGGHPSRSGGSPAADGGFDDWASDGGGGEGYDYADDYGGGGASPGGGSFDGRGGDGDDGAFVLRDLSNDLLQAPRRLAATGIKFHSASKQVDVAALKNTIWRQLVRASTDVRLQSGMQRMGLDETSAPGGEGLPVSDVPFRAVVQGLAQAPATAPGVAPSPGPSVHMCFICLLHLANEHGLAIQGAPDLATLNISQVAST